MNDTQTNSTSTAPAIVDTVDDLARMFGKTTRTIYRWVDRGMPVMRDGRFELSAVEAWRKRKKGAGSKVLAAGESQAQAHQEGEDKDWWDKEGKRWQAQLRELDYRKRRGELIERKRVEDEFVSRVHQVKAALLALERALPPDLVACRTEREMSEIIRRRVRGMLEGFARPLPSRLVNPPGMDGVSPAPGDGGAAAAAVEPESGEVV